MLYCVGKVQFSKKKNTDGTVHTFATGQLCLVTQWDIHKSVGYSDNLLHNRAAGCSIDIRLINQLGWVFIQNIYIYTLHGKC